MSTEISSHNRSVETERIHDSEEYESAEEREGEIYEDEEVEVEIEVEEIEEEEEEEEETSSIKEKALGGDEDRKNPQFIPKKGYFYEHDDRRAGDIEEDDAPEDEEKKEELKPKRVVKDTSDKWLHDMYDEEDQAPKTEEELSSRYGYDIRNDDQAPRARRRRRYGRGPNKYTPNWEEEESNERGRGGHKGRGGRRGSWGSDNRNNFRQGPPRGGGGFEEEFPELRPGDSENQERKEPKEWPHRDQKWNRDRNNVNNDREHGNETRDNQSSGNRGNTRGAWRGQGWGNRGTRGRGRRNEFTNRNRYPDRRGSNDSDVKSGLQNEHKDSEKAKVHTVGASDISAGVAGNNELKMQNLSPKSLNSNVTTQGSGFGKPAKLDTLPQIVKKPTLPFTNTEYTGSASLTAGRSGFQENELRGPRSETQSRQKLANYQDEHGDRGNKQHDDRRRSPATAEKDFGKEDEQEGHPEIQDGRESNRYNNNKGYQNDRRSHVPPRLQQQQQLSSVPGNIAAKPKRFSTQRQRQSMDQNVTTLPVNSSSPIINQPQIVPPIASTGVGPQQLGAVPPVPVPAMSAYPNHQPPPPQGYYEPVPTSFDTQIYEGSGSPITVAGTHAHGSTVSPAMWGPLSSAYVTVPYPSPPTGQGVPQQPYGDPSAFIASQSAGPPLYAPAHPHQQFIQDPSLISYPPPGPPPNFAPPPFHPAGYQGFPQVAPAPPEVYHGGVTYYSTQNQIPRPHIPVQSKRPKSMLQLVEPPEKKDVGVRNRSHQYEPHHDETVPPQDEKQFAPHQPDDDLIKPSFNEKNTSDVAKSGDNQICEVTRLELSDQKSATPPLVEESKTHIQEADSTTISLKPAADARARKSSSPAPLDMPEEKAWSEQMVDTTPINSAALNPIDLENKKDSCSSGHTELSEGASKSESKNPSKTETDEKTE